MQICKKCGLPEDLCVCESISREMQKIVVRLSTRRFRKLMTTIEGLNSKEVNIEEITKHLKNKLACGGTAKGAVIELQGDHRKKILPILVRLGFDEGTVEIK